MIKTILTFFGLLCLITFSTSFTSIIVFKGNAPAKVLATVYNRDGGIIEVDIDVQYNKMNKALELYDFRGTIKTVYKGEKYKLKPDKVERIEFKLFDKQHIFYSYTDKLKRLYYFFHAENEGDVMLLLRKPKIPDGALRGLNERTDIVPISELIGDFTTFSFIRKGEDSVVDVEDIRLQLMLQRYFKDCPELIKELNRGAYGIVGSDPFYRKREKYLFIANYYNSNCGKKKN